MNPRQKLVVYLGLSLILLSGLFPPWIHTKSEINPRGGGAIYTEKASGYAFIFIPPDPEPDRRYWAASGVRLDIARLVVQWSIISALAIALMIALRSVPGRPYLVRGLEGQTFFLEITQVRDNDKVLLEVCILPQKKPDLPFRRQDVALERKGKLRAFIGWLFPFLE